MDFLYLVPGAYGAALEDLGLQVLDEGDLAGGPWMIRVEAPSLEVAVASRPRPSNVRTSSIGRMRSPLLDTTRPEHLEVMRDHPADIVRIRHDFDLRMQVTALTMHPTFPFLINEPAMPRGLVESCSLAEA